MTTGSAYTADRIRLVAAARPDANSSALWPAAVDVPPPTSATFGVRRVDLGGTGDKAAIAALPAEAANPEGGSWPILSTGDAGNLAVAWRYLVPDER